MTSRDTALTRRRFVLGTIGVTTALAGCSDGALPAEGEETEQDDAESTPTAPPDSSTPSSNETTDGSEPGSDETTESDSVCAPLAADATPYDVSGTPYIFGFDYPETWTVEDPIPGQNGRFQRIISPEVSVDGTPRTATIRVGQSLPALSAGEVEAETEELTTRDVDQLAVVDEQTFDGEPVDVLGFPDVPPSNYPPAYILFLPYGSGDSREYYRTSIVTSTDIYDLEATERDACNGLVRTATAAVLHSLQPNPQTTVEAL